MQLQQFQVMQGVKVINETSENVGQAGHVVGFSSGGEMIDVRLDVDNGVHQFGAADIQGL